MVFDENICNCQQLKEENERLHALLIAHGIPIPKVEETSQSTIVTPNIESQSFTTTEKIAIFRRLFRGRIDVYPIRWDSANTGKSGYSPACGNEWKPGVCQKPRIKCGDCNHRLLLSVTDQVIHNHLAGKHTVGVYPLLENDTCYFLAIDFDESTWKNDALAFLQSCQELAIPASLPLN